MFAIFKIQKHELSKIDFTVEKMHFYKIMNHIQLKCSLFQYGKIELL